ncbi:MAG: YhcH/YjgK/YiaL family protein, partial [Candidatus Gastranaerophilaceae bacterium]
MIKDKLINASYYYSLSKYLKTGLEWLIRTDLENLSDGKYTIDGNNVYANIQTYETKEDAKYEAHRKYIDIQYIIKGVERVGVSDLSSCTSCIPYDSEKDIEFFDINTNEEFVKLVEGDFLILYPQDTHKPSIS